MKKIVLEFARRGLATCSFGPIILAVVYWILKMEAGLQTLTVNEVCIGIVSLSVLAFVAGGMNVIYQIERLPLMVAILIHGGVLYISYLATYLVNDWLEWGVMPILAFSAIFVVAYFVVWVIIYFTTKKKTERLNRILKLKRQCVEDN